MPACRSFTKAGQTQLALNLYDFHARQYDPALGRWHNIDPKSQFASPYLAMGNNPVMSIDPDGKWVIDLIMGIVATGQAIYTGVKYKEAGKNFWEGFGISLGRSTASYTAGKLIGGAFGGVGNWIKEGSRAVVHGAAAGGINYAFGGDFWSAAAAGTFSSAAGSGLQAANVSGGWMVAGSAVSGGISAEIAGGDFWQGAATGAIVAVANHLRHMDGKKVDLSDPDDKRLYNKILKAYLKALKSKEPLTNDDLFDFSGVELSSYDMWKREFIFYDENGNKQIIEVTIQKPHSNPKFDHNISNYEWYNAKGVRGASTFPGSDPNGKPYYYPAYTQMQNSYAEMQAQFMFHRNNMQTFSNFRSYLNTGKPEYLFK